MTTEQATSQSACDERIYLLVQQIPAGMVATYGDIAALVGGGCNARTVGYALGALGERANAVPWQRVINSAGTISTRGVQQRTMLEAEGVAFDRRDRVMVRHRWNGPPAAWATAHGYTPLPPREPPAEQLELL